METERACQAIIPCVNPTTDDTTRWFSCNGCVVRQPDEVEVFVDGTLISRFAPKNLEVRNLTLVVLSKNPAIKKGKLAAAFGISAEALRRMNRRFEADGIDGIRPSPNKGGRKTKVTPALRKKLYELFEETISGHEAFVELGDDPEVSYPVVCRVRQVWAAEQAEAETPDAAKQLELDSRVEEEAVDEEPVEEESVEGQAPRSSRNVRHVGGWLLIAMAHAYGLHSALQQHWKSGKRWKERLRVVVDAVIIALGIGQRCVEGVRRLEASNGGVLLRAKRVPSESWSRRVLKKYVAETSVSYAHLAMTQNYLDLAAARSKGATVFYVDNHMRPYTGKHVIRKGWRMQDKHVVAGVSDYYVHDEDGRPVYRMSVPSHDSLTTWLSPIMRILRTALGDEERILVAFDRAGAFPEQLTKLRDEGFEFVTYERRPYQNLAASFFSETVKVDGETYGIHETRLANLGKGRGRVRRIAVLTPEGKQINLLATSEEKKERLLEVMLGRWIQENGFKHGNERWGINQLDRRAVEAYPPETVIPNPGRRRLDNALKLARHREGDARNKLARMKKDHHLRSKVERDLKEALAEQSELLAQRPSLPKHAPLEETELKGKLVYHRGDYKMLIDTIRIACANAESELACVLADFLRRPREAKKVLANIFAATGQVRVNGKSITITLDLAGTRNEQEAVEELFQVINRWKLTLPGDSKSHSLRFRSQLS